MEKDVFHAIQPLVPTEEKATDLGISPQSEDIITERNDDAVCDLLEDSHAHYQQLQKTSSETIIVPDENGSDESSREKIFSLVDNREGADQTDEQKAISDSRIYGNIKTKATHYHYGKTSEVPEPLRKDCAKQHTRKKMSKDHELCDKIREFSDHQKVLSAKTEHTDAQEVFCDPCLYDDIKTKATHYCKTCDVPEPLCIDCAKQHTRQKLSRDHEICDNIIEFHKNQKDLKANTDKGDQENIFCDPCLYEDIKTKATHYCITCDVPEPLCNDCAKQHSRQKLSRDHELCDIQEFLEHQKNASANADQKDIFCIPCLSEDIKIKATHYCKTCDFPEPLCNDCAKQHIRQKLSRDHEICDNIREFDNNQKDSNPKAVQKDQREIFCDPCLYGEIKSKATHYCKTCDFPEPLCNDCAKQHTRQKLSRDHKLCDDLREFPDHQNGSSVNEDQTDQYEVVCEPCLCGEIKSKATHYCKTCDVREPLCNDCAKQHTRQKLSRDHELCDDIRQFQKYQRYSNANEDIPKKEILCYPCGYGDIQTRATHFCKTCDVPEPLCQDCAQQHTRQKLSRDHELCDEMEKMNIQKHQHKQDEKIKFCDLCLRKNLRRKQTHFCKTCEVPEALCKDCAQQHTRKRVSRHHEICEDAGKLKSFKQCLEKKKQGSYDNKCPGKPQLMYVKSDSVSLIWEKSCESVNQYQVRYKTNKANAKWKFIETDADENHIIVSGLMANTTYTFQVRGIFGDQEGPFGQVNENIETKKSLATVLLDFSQLQNKSSNPSIYLLPVEENGNARNKSARTRQLILGNPSLDYHDEKTIMLVGATGSGKSTLVDGIANYIMGVSFEDPFRFTMVTLEEEEKKTHNQAISQTEWITVYKIYPTEGSRLSYTLNIIDTPGFGDTRGIERDNAIVDQIRQLFSAKGDQGVLYIDAVCFIVKAPDARLTVVQKYIFSSIMSLFGKDIESNICTLITFADGAKPPVLASLKESRLPFGLTFSFNNSALFAENNELIHNTLSPMFWKMGCSSFEMFFAHISRLQTRSLCQTKNVLDEREQLKTVISNIRPQVTAGLSKLSELQQQLDIFKRYQNEIEDNQNFEYEVDETRQELVDLPKGQHVTNCLQCNTTCHEECQIADDDKKSGCWAMDRNTGQCRICTGKCIWSDHKNTPYIFKYVTETVKKTYSEMKERYEAAQGHTLTHETYIEELTNDVEDLFEEIMAKMNEMNQCKTRLKEIALRPDPLSAIEHIDLMIQSEETEKQPGYFKRVQMLKEIKRMSLVDQDVENFGQNIRHTRENIKSITGKTFPRRNHRNISLAMGTTIQTRVRPRKKNVFALGVQFVKKLW